MADDHDKHGASGSHGGGGGGSHGGGHGHGGGGGHAEGEHEGAPEWLISFADNVMLQMGFFVILLAMNMGPKGSDQGSEGKESQSAKQQERMDEFVIAIREGFNSPVNMTSARPEEVALARRLKERKGGLASSEGVSGRNPLQQSVRPSDFQRVGARVEFDDRDATISPAARATIAEFAQKQRDQRWIIAVRGHASPFESMRNPLRAMELSYQRAIAVAQALVDSGMSWGNLRVEASGDGDRVVGRTFDRAADRANQRVELVVTDEPIPADPYAGSAQDEEPAAPAPAPAAPR